MTVKNEGGPPARTTRELAGADFLDIESQLDERERAKLAEVRAFVAEYVTEHAGAWWTAEEFPFDLLPRLGALGVSTPTRHGYSTLFHGLLIAELARADASLATFFMIHHDLFVESLHDFGTEGQRERYLADAAALRTTGAFALTEPEHGSDVAKGMETRARREGDAWIINGAKRWIGNGTFCEHLLLWALDEDTGAVRGFVLDTSLPGVTTSKIENKISLRTVQNADIVLRDVRVMEEDRFPGIDSFADINQLLRSSRIMVGWLAVGQQLAAFDVLRAYVLEREQFGRPLASFQLIQQKLATMLGNATASMALMTQIARAQSQGTEKMEQAALAKAFATERMRESVALGRAAMGGNGIVTDHRMARIFADAEAIYTYEGTHDINLLIVGRAATGISAIA
ncbi:MAG: acyl-CoA dehydrogenase family protein [Arthrobacter sp.]|uniref:acyl-CoA dehydrogenase family protein n=1 Tax=Arthrobacter TaxID=1663 RepID=UPI00264A9C85|nr:acyl-CoA dehydrogenase family protein [Micrococcaceae bacterium]MDN5813369.1 acyl-CoA dehydrogenase family protein [Micrococcaceae bacterium]MDN5825098.1 acyl-CoA dehydrogenase family protein [Micrococcaceae bacterium]MDN5879486.1 acyl-CoA dehydrogenase family protein [Micrococcaceae bacterium]MDN5886850.1 acyl-CoA dehydrogenase family protein [Micrococcaceae bacterium]